MNSAFYFEPFEGRRPPPPVAHSDARELLFQTLAVAALALGAWYLWWRWTRSLNPAALWFAVPLAIAETLAYVGSLFFFLSIWRTRDTPEAPPPRTVNDLSAQPTPGDRPLVVDVFFPTYSEDPELVRLSIRDGKKLRYPHPIDLRLHVLDDGRRAAMKADSCMARAGGPTLESTTITALPLPTMRRSPLKPGLPPSWPTSRTPPRV